MARSMAEDAPKVYRAVVTLTRGYYAGRTYVFGPYRDKRHASAAVTRETRHGADGMGRVEESELDWRPVA